MLEGRAAMQSDLGRLKEWVDGNHMKFGCNEYTIVGHLRRNNVWQ